MPAEERMPVEEVVYTLEQLVETDKARSDAARAISNYRAEVPEP